jgi:hypothetical protein
MRSMCIVAELLNKERINETAPVSILYWKGHPPPERLTMREQTGFVPEIRDQDDLSAYATSARNLFFLYKIGTASE